MMQVNGISKHLKLLGLLALVAMSTVAQGIEVRINAGGPEYTDANGALWSADTNFNTGQSAADGVGSDILGTVDDDLYQRQRWDRYRAPDLIYEVAVPDGEYTVKLHFAETYSGNFAVGARVFDTFIEDQLEISALDIFSEAGGALKALIKTIQPVVVADGGLTIRFDHATADNPTIAAIEIISVPSAPDVSPPSIPDGLAASASDTEVDLSWNSATDTETGVAGYRVFRNGVEVGTTVGTNYTDSGLLAETSYDYTVLAFDGASPANESGLSASLTVTTLPGPDVTAPTVPTGLAATPAATEVALTWSAATDSGSGVAGYRVFRDGVEIATTAATSYTDIGLAYDTSYDYTVTAYDGASPANESAQSAVLTIATLADTTAPSVPQNLTATPSNTSVNLTWDVATDSETGVAGYRIFRDGADVGTTATTSFTDTGLSTDTSYDYSVSAYDNASPANESVASDVVSTTTLAVAPVALYRINAGGSAYVDSAGNNWSADTNFNTGRVASDGVGTDITNTLNDELFQYQRWDKLSSPSLIYNMAVPNGDYTVNLLFAETYSGNFAAGARVFEVYIEDQLVISNLDIFAEAGGGNAALIKSIAGVAVADGSLTVRFKHSVADNPTIGAIEVLSVPAAPDATAPTVPQNVVAVPAVDSVALTWDASTDSESGVAGYRIFRNGGEVATTTATNYTDTGLSADTGYDYSVAAYDNQGNESSVSAVVSTTTLSGLDITAPSVPQNLAATADTTSVGLTWDAATDTESGVAGYRIYRDGSEVGTSTETSYTDTGLLAETGYIYTVSAYDVSTNESAPSAGVSVTTLAAPDVTAPTVPTGLAATPAATEVALTWNAATDSGSGVAGYRVFRDGVEIATTAATSYTDIGLAYDTSYDYTVTAYDGASPANESAQSAVLTIATLADTTAPSVPQNLTATPSNTSVNLTWDVATDSETGVAGYRIFRDGADVGTTATTSFTDTGLSTDTSYDYSVSAYDNASPANESVASDVVSTTTLAVAPVALYRINAGGSAYVDSAGNNWSADTNFNTGRVASDGVGTDITNTLNDELFQYQRWDKLSSPSLIYNMAVPNGDYTVNLLFAETYSGNFAAGARVFEVYIEDQLVISNLDIFAEAGGGNAALIKSIAGVAVADGSLTVRFKHSVADNPTIGAIEVLSVPAAPDATAPTVPQNVVAVPAVDSVALTWDASTDSESGVAGYRIFRNGGEVATTTATNYTDTGLTASTNYDYSVTAFDNQGNESSPSDVVFTATLSGPDITAPSVPDGLAGTPSGTEIALTWTPSTDAETGVTGYRVFRDGVEIGTTATASYTDTGLDLDTSYGYTVSAFDGASPANESAQSAVFTIATLADTTAPSVPQNLAATPASDSVALMWDASTDADSVVAGYRVYREGIELGTTSFPSYTDTTVTPDTSYNYTVTAFDSYANESAASAALPVMTLSVQANVIYDFSTSDLSDWSFLTESGLAFDWRVDNNQLLQGIDAVPKNFVEKSYRIGTYAVLSSFSSSSDYTVGVDITPQRDVYLRSVFDGQDVGVMFRYVDQNNYYRVAMNANSSYMRFEKKVNGNFSSLAVNARGYLEEQTYHFQITVKGDLIVVELDGEQVFAVRDTDLSTGTIALYCQDNAYFDNVSIADVPSAPKVALGGPGAYSVVVGDSVSAEAVVLNAPPGSYVEFDFNGAFCNTATESPVGSGFYSASCDNLAQGDYTQPGTGLTAYLYSSSDVLLDSAEHLSVGILGDAYITIGDSITMGSYDTYDYDNQSQDGRIIGQQGYQAHLNDLLTSHTAYPNIIFNNGIGGDRSAQTKWRMESILDRHSGANKMLVMLGTNDANSSSAPDLATYLSNMQFVVDKGLNRNLAVWVARMPPSMPVYDPDNLARNAKIVEYNGGLPSLSNVSMGPDFYSFFLDDNGTPGDTSDDYDLFSMYLDKLHPNSLGQQVMAELWFNALTGSNIEPFYLDRLCNRLESSDCTATSPTSHKQNYLHSGYPYHYVDEFWEVTSTPALLDGGIWVQTLNAEFNNTADDYIYFEVDRAVEVFVAYDDGAASLPTWLQSAFTDTGTTINTEDPNTPTLRVYSKVFTAGSISLGGNLATGASGANSNYIVVVKEL